MPVGKRRALRWFGLVAGAVVLCLVVLLLSPPVQRQLTKAAADRVENLELEIGYVWAGPWGVEIEDLRLELPLNQLQIHAERAAVDFAFWRSLFGLEIDIETIELRDVDIDVRARASEGGGERRTRALLDLLSTTGIGPSARMPARLAIGELEADGEFRVVTPRDVEIAGTWQLAAQSIARDSSGTLRLATDVRTARSGEVLAAARFGVDGSMRIDARSLIRDLNVTANVEPMTGEAGVAADFSAALGEEESFRASLRGRAGPLAELAVRATPGQSIDLSWEANLTPGVVAAFARGDSAADLSGTSNGRLLYDVNDGSLEAESSTEIRGAGWEAYDPRFAALGELTLAVELNGGYTTGVVDADRLELAITSGERGELLLVRAEQPLRYDFGEWLVIPQTWGEPALRIQVAELPLAWVGLLTPTIELQGGVLNGALEFVRREERVTELRVVEPIRASGVRLAPINAAAVPEFDVSIEPRATLANGALEAEIEALRLTAATGFDFAFAGRATTSRTQWPQATLQGDVEARVPMLQRIVPRLDSVHVGLDAALDFETLVLAIDQAMVDAVTADGLRILAAELAGRTPLRLQLPVLDADWNGFEPRTASVQLDRAPIDWVSDFVPELEFRGGEVSGLLTASGAVGSGLRLEAQEPLRIEGFIPSYRGVEAASAWSASVRPRLDLRTTGSSIALEDLTVVSLRGNSVHADLLLEEAGDGRITTSLALATDLGEYASRSGVRIGEIHLQQRSTLEPSRQRYTVEELSLDVQDRTGNDVVTVEALETFSISAAPFSVAVAGAPRDILRATVTPIELERLLPNVLNLDLQGLLPEGEFFGRAEPDGALVFFTADPLVFRDVSVRWGEATLLDRVTTSVLYEVGYSGDGLQARSVELTATGPDGRTLLRSSSRVTAPMRDTRFLNRGATEFEANLEPLSQQPVLGDLPPLTSGTLAGSFSFVNEDETSVSMSLQLRDAGTAAIGKLADLDVALQAVGVPGERLSLVLPVRMESQDFGVSSLQLDGALVVNAEGVTELDASLDGERVAADDLRRFLSYALATGDSGQLEEPDAAESGGLTPLSEETLSAIARLRTERHSIPVWTDHLIANTRVDLDEVVFSGFHVEDVRGALEVTPDSATLTDIHASLFGAGLLAEARMEFDAEQAAPYSLDFRADIEDLELAEVFLALSPDSVPLAEGHFELTSTLTSAGRNPLDLALSSHGRLHLTGGDGVFRGLAAHAGTGSVAARVIGILTFSRELRAIGRMLDGLGEIRFDDAEFLLERNRTDRIDVSSLALRSPQLRLGVTGSLELARLRPMLQSPLDADLSLAARGDPEILFEGMGLLEEAADADGYRSFTRPVHVGGTPVEPDATEFWELLEEAADNARGVLGVGLRAINRRLEARGE